MPPTLTRERQADWGGAGTAADRSEGRPGEVLTEALLDEVFGLEATVVDVGGVPVVVPDRRLAG